VDYVVVNVAQRVSVLVSFSKLLAPRPQAIFMNVAADLTVYGIDPTVERPGFEPAVLPYVAPIYLQQTFKAVIDFSNGVAPIPTYNKTLPLNYTGVGTISDSNLLAARPLNVAVAPNATHALLMEIEFEDDAMGVNHAFWNNITFPLMQVENSDSPLLFEQIVGLTYTAQYALVPPTPIVGAAPGSPSMTVHGNAISEYSFPFGSVVQIFIRNTDDGQHPIHLHGHDFWVIATSEFPDSETLFSGNYAKRDVVTVPADGWAIIRFIANNPGVWPFHCHIDWHMAAGFFAVFVEAPELLPTLTIPGDHISICAVGTGVPCSGSSLSNAWTIGGGAAIGVAGVLIITLSVLLYRTRKADQSATDRTVVALTGNTRL